MKIVDILTGEKHEVKAYYKTYAQEIIETETWAGCHIIGIDCEFESDAKCECVDSTGWMTEKVCNICGKVIKQELPEKTTTDGILNMCCSYFNVPVELAKSKTRRREVVQTRQVAMTLSQEYETDSQTNIGIIYGGFNHSTCNHAKKTIKNLLETDKKFKIQYDEITSKII